MILVGDEEGLRYLHLDTGDSHREFHIEDEWILDNSFFSDTIKQLSEYIEGRWKIFNIKLNPQGTPFQKMVWNALKGIPYGEVRSYKKIASDIGNEKSSRAVGMANSKNPIPIIVPCHRVIGSNGQLTGYAFGLAIKAALLEIEKES